MAADGKQRARTSRRQPWAPFVLLGAVGVALVWLGWRVELGRLRGWALGTGTAVVGVVVAVTANRLRKRRQPGGDR